MDQATTSKSKAFAGLDFDNSYALLPERFYVKQAPISVRDPKLIKLNLKLADELGLDEKALSSDEGVTILSGNSSPQGSESLAMAYSGHQFGHFSPVLGDGRALLMGEMLDNKSERRDIQLKGSGPTPFSRGGDGRSALGPVIREYIVSEAMHNLGIRTTRSLAMVTTGEIVEREGYLPGAILTRVASSHIRIGTFQYFAMRGDFEGIKLLVDHVIARHYPSIESAENRALALLEAIIEAQAKLVASWMGVGFIHGVMNTDNMTVSGETIDYGPCAFMDYYDKAQVYSSIDQRGRYAYVNQPAIAQWNLARFAETLLPLIDDDQDNSVKLALVRVKNFNDIYKAEWLKVMRRKLGLTSEDESDEVLINSLFELMQKHSVDFTQTFRALSHAAADEKKSDDLDTYFTNDEGFSDWLVRWKKRLTKQSQSVMEISKSMLAVNPVYIPRNHRIEEVIADAQDHEDFSKMEELIEVLSKPFDDNDNFTDYVLPPKPEEVVLQTFCGT